MDLYHVLVDLPHTFDFLSQNWLKIFFFGSSTYNADFDGDEMNVHFPQDEISRAEAYNIVNANNQYARPSNGDPLRALIQVVLPCYFFIPFVCFILVLVHELGCLTVIIY